jgi:tRNA U34 5-methylaminomethyl-2-thiouridine-forming methyltransferase MnmC
VEKKIIMTRDGSHSIAIPEMNVTYHSIHGALQESTHVFINTGLLASDLFDYIGVHHVLEIGFGTGLNALLTLVEADKHQNRIYYTAVEPYPLAENEIKPLNYCEQLNLSQYQSRFERMHETGWEEMFEITQHFRLTKTKCSLHDFAAEQMFRIIYFDAFAPAAQPELWTRKIFENMYNLLLPDGILVTYCSKGEVRRNMQAAGFTIEKIPGPRGKREMLRARK